MCRLLHYLAKLTGQGELALAFCAQGFDKHNVAADCRPSQTCHNADLISFERTLDVDLWHSQIFAEIFDSYLNWLELPFLFGFLTSDLATNFADLAFELAETGLLRVLTDHLGECFFIEPDIRS